MLDREVTKLNIWYLEYYIPYCRVFFCLSDTLKYLILKTIVFLFLNNLLDYSCSCATKLGLRFLSTKIGLLRLEDRTRLDKNKFSVLFAKLVYIYLDFN